MTSRTKPIRPARLALDVLVQQSLSVTGVLREVGSASFGLCIEAGKAVLAAMMESESAALCGPKGRPDATRSAYRGGRPRLCSAVVALPLRARAVSGAG